MGMQEKRVDLRVGPFACSIQGYDEPAEPLRRILAVMTDTFGALVAGPERPLFDPGTLARIEKALADDDPDGAVRAIPGLVIAREPARPADGDLDLDAARPVAVAEDGHPVPESLSEEPKAPADEADDILIMPDAARVREPGRTDGPSPAQPAPHDALPGDVFDSGGDDGTDAGPFPDSGAAEASDSDTLREPAAPHADEAVLADDPAEDGEDGPELVLRSPQTGDAGNGATDGADADGQTGAGDQAAASDGTGPGSGAAHPADHEGRAYDATAADSAERDRDDAPAADEAAAASDEGSAPAVAAVDEPATAAATDDVSAAAGEPDDESASAGGPEDEPAAAAEPDDEPVATAGPDDDPVAPAEPDDEPVATAEADDDPVAAAEPDDEPVATAGPDDDPVAAPEPDDDPVAADGPDDDPVGVAGPDDEPVAAAEVSNAVEDTDEAERAAEPTSVAPEGGADRSGARETLFAREADAASDAAGDKTGFDPEEPEAAPPSNVFDEVDDPPANIFAPTDEDGVNIFADEADPPRDDAPARRASGRNAGAGPSRRSGTVAPQAAVSTRTDPADEDEEEWTGESLEFEMPPVERVSFRDLTKEKRHRPVQVRGEPAPPEEAPEEDEDASSANGPSAGELAKLVSASDVPDLISVSAAWINLVKGQPTFSRKAVLEVYERMPGNHPRTLEAKIKGFGKLVRNGTIESAGVNLFTLSRDQRARYETLMR